MRVRLEQRPVERLLAAIEAQRSPGLFESVSKILLTRHKVDRPGLSLILFYKIKQRVEIRLALSFGHLCHGHPVIFLQGGIDYARKHYTGPAAAVEIEVLPVCMFHGHFFLEALANLWIAQALKEFVRAAVGDPWRQRRN